MVPSADNDHINTKKQSSDPERGRLSGTDQVDFKAAPHEEVTDNIFDGEGGEGFCNMARWDALFMNNSFKTGSGVQGSSLRERKGVSLYDKTHLSTEML
ncbi:hypothetical protein N0V84_010583 [Fusarium piperis]|uniref:Uncharacterized protein n=1 Tax=Fusarium piperis TaxID=1435070 RepID=A0A9W8W1H6_9HYPO|nr:hypothetical protein N0V84_010583 [Fusarium piperis]